jgi:hypothetical protein
MVIVSNSAVFKFRFFLYIMFGAGAASCYDSGFSKSIQIPAYCIRLRFPTAISFLILKFDLCFNDTDCLKGKSHEILVPFWYPFLISLDRFEGGNRAEPGLFFVLMTFSCLNFKKLC